MRKARTWRGCAIFLMVALAASACGTRLPDSAFVNAGAEGTGTSGGTRGATGKAGARHGGRNRHRHGHRHRGRNRHRHGHRHGGRNRRRRRHGWWRCRRAQPGVRRRRHRERDRDRQHHRGRRHARQRLRSDVVGCRRTSVRERSGGVHGRTFASRPATTPRIAPTISSADRTWSRTSRCSHSSPTTLAEGGRRATSITGRAGLRRHRRSPTRPRGARTTGRSTGATSRDGNSTSAAPTTSTAPPASTGGSTGSSAPPRPRSSTTGYRDRRSTPATSCIAGPQKLEGLRRHRVRRELRQPRLRSARAGHAENGTHIIFDVIDDGTNRKLCDTVSATT